MFSSWKLKLGVLKEQDPRGVLMSLGTLLGRPSALTQRSAAAMVTTCAFILGVHTLRFLSLGAAQETAHGEFYSEPKCLMYLYLCT